MNDREKFEVMKDLRHSEKRTKVLRNLIFITQLYMICTSSLDMDEKPCHRGCFQLKLHPELGVNIVVSLGKEPDKCCLTN